MADQCPGDRALTRAVDVLDTPCNQKFTILCDQDNDTFVQKYFAVLVKYRDNQLDKVVTWFFDALATSQVLFDALDTIVCIPGYTLGKYAVGFASDSASFMVSKKNNVLSRVKNQ